MAAILKDADERVAQYSWFEALDGDEDLLETEVILDGTPERLRALPPVKGSWGLRIKPDHVATRLKRGGGAPMQEWDFGHLHGSPLVTERLKALIERFEPGVHQFWPMPVEDEAGERAAMRYWLTVCNRIDAFDKERSVPPVTGLLYIGFGREGSRPVLRSEVIGNCHLWRDVYCNRPYPFVSDVLADAMIAEAMTGADIQRIEEV